MKLNTQVNGIDLIELGKVIRWYRRSFNLTQRELAKRIGTSLLCVSNWEQGKNKMLRVDMLVKMARLFGISELDILYPSEEVQKCLDFDRRKS